MVMYASDARFPSRAAAWPCTAELRTPPPVPAATSCLTPPPGEAAQLRGTPGSGLVQARRAGPWEGKGGRLGLGAESLQQEKDEDEDGEEAAEAAGTGLLQRWELGGGCQRGQAARGWRAALGVTVAWPRPFAPSWHRRCLPAAPAQDGGGGARFTAGDGGEGGEGGGGAAPRGRNYDSHKAARPRPTALGQWEGGERSGKAHVMEAAANGRRRRP